MLSPKTASVNVRTILDLTCLHVSRNLSLCPHIYSVPSVVNCRESVKARRPLRQNVPSSVFE